MEYIITNFATTDTSASPKGDLFGSVGVDWTLLALQLIAFVILMLILKKFVYPPLSAVWINEKLKSKQVPMQRCKRKNKRHCPKKKLLNY